MGDFILDQSLLSGPDDTVSAQTTAGRCRWVQFVITQEENEELKILGLLVYAKPYGERRDS
jgi:hypothetical protein